MALLYPVQYELDFDTNAGADINYTLELLRGYEEGTTPSWFEGGEPPAVRKLVGTGEPITIEYQKDYDVYKPIQGSNAKLNLVVQTDGQYNDFASGGRYEWQVRLRRTTAVPIGDGARVEDAGGTPLTFAAETGTRIADRFGSGLMSVRISGGDKATTVPVLDSSNEGRWVYVSNDGGATVVPIGTLASTEYSSATRIQLVDTKGYGSDTALDTALANYSVGDEVWLADEGDTGDSTSFTGSPVEYHPVWCGFIDPVDSNERVSTFPFSLSYTALDGLGRLGESTVPGIENTTSNIFNGSSDISLLNVIFYALEQTGLGLDVYIDSGIQQTAGDALINAMVDPYSFYTDTERTERETLKEALNGILSSFNCKITQANGRWYIYNASSLADTTTWKVYNSNRVAQADVTESLVMTITGDNSTQLIPATNDLIRPLRTPVGSVEARPNMVERQIESNGGFELGTTGWSGGVDALNLQSVIRYQGQSALRSDRNTRAWESINDTWVVNTTGFPVSTDGDITIDMNLLGVINLGEDADQDLAARNIHVGYQVYFVPDTADTAGFLNISPGLVPTNAVMNVTGYYYDFINNEWLPKTTSFVRGTDNATDLGGKLADTTRNFIIEPGAVNRWVDETVTLNAPREYFDYGGDDGNAYLPIPSGKIFIRVFYPRSNRLKGHGQNSFTRGSTQVLTVYLDNIRVRNDFPDEITSPVFERIQTDFTQTLTYEPKFASSTNEFLIQTLDVKSYNRTGKTENKSLEEAVTQQKFNDRARRFKYYEGTLINNTTIPLSNINKPKVNFSWTQNGTSRTFIEPFAGIMNGGEFMVKSNKFKTAFYIPDQSSDLSPTNRGDVDSGDYVDGNLQPGYYTQNIDLVPAPFPGRSEKVSYTLAFEFTSILDENGDVVSEGYTVAGGNPYIHVTGLPGETKTFELRLETKDGYISDPVNTVVATDTTTDDGEPGVTPRPVFIEFNEFSNARGDLILPYTLTFPEQPEFETLHIDGKVVNFAVEGIPDVVETRLIVNNPNTLQVRINGSASASNTIDVSGRPGDGKSVTLDFSPVDPDSDVVEVTSIDVVGASTIAEPVPITQTTNGSSATINLSVPTSSTLVEYTLNPTIDIDPVETDSNPYYNYDLSFNLSGLGNVKAIATKRFRGPTGDENPYRVTLIPEDDYFFTSTSGLVITLPSGVVFADGSTTNHNAVIDGDNLEFDITVIVPNNGGSGTLGVSGATTQEEPNVLNFIINNNGLDSSVATPGSVTRRFDVSDFGDNMQTFDITIASGTGMEFTDSADVLVELDDEQFTAGANSNYPTLTNPDQAFTVTNMPVVGGNAVKRVSGIFPTVLDGESGEYTIAINVSGTPQRSGATAGGTTLTWLGPDVPAQGGPTSFELTTDGNWSARMAGLGPGSDGSTTGLFNFDYTVSGASSSWSTYGSFSPIIGEAGEHTITVVLGGLGGDDPQTFVDYGFLRNVGSVEIVSGGVVIATAEFNQEHNVGGRTITLPAGTSDADAAGISINRPTWTFYN